MKMLITGATGLISFHLSILLLHKGYQVVGINNLNAYNDINLKEDRISYENKTITLHS